MELRIHWECNPVDGAGCCQVTVLWGDPGEGSVSVTETSADDRAVTAETLNVTIEICDYVQELSSGNIMIYPNPARDLINIALRNVSDDQIERILVRNSPGQMLNDNKINTGTLSADINISGYPSGFYFVEAISDEEVLTLKF